MSEHSMQERLADLNERRDQAIHAGPERSVERQHAKGKMLARERIEYLLSLYPDESSAAWCYDRALHAFRVHGGDASATRELRTALRVNGFVPEFLFGVREFPADMPKYIGWGDESEAVAYAGEALGRWFETPGALRWLESKAASKSKPRAKPGRRRKTT